MSEQETNSKLRSYIPSVQIRFAILLFVVAALVYTLFNYQDWITRERSFDTKGWVVFVSDISGFDDIWVADKEGKIKQLTNDEAEDVTPTWSPTGNQIIFSSTRESAASKKIVFQLYSIRPDGTVVQPLTIGGGAKQDPHFSKDGRTVLHLAQGFVTEVDIKDHHAAQLLPPAERPDMIMSWREQFGESVGVRHALWAPTNENLILAQLPPAKGNMLMLADISDPNKPSLAFILAAKRLEFVWSPVSTDIVAAFQEPIPLSTVVITDVKDTLPLKHGIIVFTIMPNEEAKASGSPFIIRFDDNRSLVAKSVVNMGKDYGLIEPSFKPDGAQMVFVLAKMKGAEVIQRMGIVVYPTSSIDSAKGGLEEPTTIVRGNVGSPAWSPDGSKLAYVVYTESGHRDIWTVNIDGTNATNLTNGKGDNREPVWSPQR
jgi:TolB protein